MHLNNYETPSETIAKLRCDLARHRVAVEGLQNDVAKLKAQLEETEGLYSDMCSYAATLENKIDELKDPTKPQAGEEVSDE